MRFLLCEVNCFRIGFVSRAARPQHFSVPEAMGQRPLAAIPARYAELPFAALTSHTGVTGTARNEAETGQPDWVLVRRRQPAPAFAG